MMQPAYVACLLACLAARASAADSRTKQLESLEAIFDPDLADPDYELGSFLETEHPEKRQSPVYVYDGERKSYLDVPGSSNDQKRAPLEIVTFPCFRKSDAVCLNGGRGPKVMRKGKTVMCVCMCPFGYVEPRCERSWWHQ